MGTAAERSESENEAALVISHPIVNIGNKLTFAPKFCKSMLNATSPSQRHSQGKPVATRLTSWGHQRELAAPWTAQI